MRLVAILLVPPRAEDGRRRAGMVQWFAKETDFRGKRKEKGEKNET